MTTAQKVLTVDRTTVRQADIALPFTTDEEVVASWEWLVEHRRLTEFRYSPETDGENDVRALIAAYFASPADERPRPDAATVRSMIDSLYGAELPYRILDAVDPFERG